jgi:hypothetical protein
VSFAGGAARADFIVKPAPDVLPMPAAPSAPGPPAVSDTPHIDPGDIADKQIVPLVRGFGDHVPLAFAVRQIVPARIKVSYGPGVDPDTLVSWKGGDTWPAVLGRAIRPHGLHMISSGLKLQIKS